MAVPIGQARRHRSCGVVCYCPLSNSPTVACVPLPGGPNTFTDTSNSQRKFPTWRFIVPTNLALFARALFHKPIDYECSVLMRYRKALPLRAKLYIRRLMSQDVIAIRVADRVLYRHGTIHIVPNPLDVVIVRRVLRVACIVGAMGRVGGTGGGEFGEGLDLSGDHGWFGRPDFEELIVGGGRIRGEPSISWIGDSKREV